VTSAKMIRVGPEALAEAEAGRLRLVYLYRTIPPRPLPVTDT
jgi:hypothetical protein